MRPLVLRVRFALPVLYQPALTFPLSNVHQAGCQSFVAEGGVELQVRSDDPTKNNICTIYLE